MSGVDARYLGLTANQLAKIATDLKSENARLRKLSAEMFKEHKRIIAMPKAYRQGTSALYTQMAIWSSECISLGIEVPDA